MTRAPRTRRTDASGFTVVEVIIALVLIAIVVGSAVQVIGSARSGLERRAVKDSMREQAQKAVEDLPGNAALQNCLTTTWRNQEASANEATSQCAIPAVTVRDEENRYFRVTRWVTPINSGDAAASQTLAVWSESGGTTSWDPDQNTRDSFEVVARVEPDPSRPLANVGGHMFTPLVYGTRVKYSTLFGAGAKSFGRLLVTSCVIYRDNADANPLRCQNLVGAPDECMPDTQTGFDSTGHCARSQAVSVSYTIQRIDSYVPTTDWTTKSYSTSGLFGQYEITDIPEGNYRITNASGGGYDYLDTNPIRIEIRAGQLSEAHINMVPKPSPLQLCWVINGPNTYTGPDHEYGAQVTMPDLGPHDYGFHVSETNFLIKEKGSPIYEILRLHVADNIKIVYNGGHTSKDGPEAHCSGTNPPGVPPENTYPGIDLHDPLRYRTAGDKLFLGKYIFEVEGRPRRLEIMSARIDGVACGGSGGWDTQLLDFSGAEPGKTDPEVDPILRPTVTPNGPEFQRFLYDHRFYSTSPNMPPAKMVCIVFQRNGRIQMTTYPTKGHWETCSYTSGDPPVTYYYPCWVWDTWYEGPETQHGSSNPPDKTSWTNANDGTTEVGT